MPNRDAATTAPPPKLALQSVVRIDVHRSKDRVKDASPRRGTLLRANVTGCIRFVTAHADVFPSSAPFGHPLSSARCQKWRNHLRQFGPNRDLPSNDAPRRAPPSRRPGCLSPPRHAKDCLGKHRGEIAFSGLHAGSLAHAAHTFSPLLGNVFLDGHCEVTVQSPASP